MSGKGGRNPNAGRKPSLDLRMARRFGLNGVNGKRKVQRMGGARKIARMSPEARSLMKGLARITNDI